MRKGAVLILFFILLLMQPYTVRAHKVSLFAYSENGTVYAEAYFVDGTPCKNARITATDSDGVVVAEGMTDDEGMFSFPSELNEDLTIAVRASMGHGSEILLTVVDPEIKGGSSEEGDPAGSRTEKIPAVDGNPSMDKAAIEKIVEDRIQPIRDSIREIRKNQDKPTLGKIIGGLGWIIGLAGAYLWGAAYRKNKA